MRFVVVLISALLIGSLASVNSPGAAIDPIVASDDDLRAYIAVAEEMHGRWQVLDAACDPDAIFGLLYLITTGAVGDLVAADHFADNPNLVTWDADFAGRYFSAYDAYHAGEHTPEPWRIAFEHADSGKSTVSEDLLLGMNAHVNYDLSFSAYAMGLPQTGQKADYDRVNDAFWNVPAPQGNEFDRRYEAGQQQDPDEERTVADEATMELLISWREAAWINAQALANAPNAAARELVAASIEAEAAAAARGIAQNSEDTTAERTAYCEASGHPPLPAAIGGPGYGAEWLAEDAPEADKFWICHKPGTQHEKTMFANEHSWTGHEGHGDHKGAC